jgi:hypothetical protein
MRNWDAAQAKNEKLLISKCNAIMSGVHSEYFYVYIEMYNRNCFL